MHHYNAAPYKTILFLHQHLYFPSKLAQIYNIQTRLATKVVCLLIPTSNHNPCARWVHWNRLYIFWFLHQTTTVPATTAALSSLYIFWFLHQTTTLLTQSMWQNRCISFDSYIKPQLQIIRMYSILCCISFDSYIKPQPKFLYNFLYLCCISFDSYIKPQLAPTCRSLPAVVYLLIPTSNHNARKATELSILLYIFWFLHQTTTLYV